jgi:hypothetical protein
MTYGIAGFSGRNVIARKMRESLRASPEIRLPVEKEGSGGKDCRARVQPSHERSLTR